MSIFTTQSNQHTFHAFDTALSNLNGILLNIAELLEIQLELSLQAFEKSESQYAVDAISLSLEIESLKCDFDLKVPAVIAKFWPVANDLKFIVSLLKIADQLENIGDKVVDFARFADQSLSSPTDALSPGLLSDTIEIGRYVLSLLNVLKIAIDTNDIEVAFSLLEADRALEKALYEKLESQLASIVADKGNGDLQSVMKVVGLLEFCPAEIRRILAAIVWNRLSDCSFRHQWISDAAYYFAERRNFAPGYELDDWLIAEQAFLTKLVVRYEATHFMDNAVTAKELIQVAS